MSEETKPQTAPGEGDLNAFLEQETRRLQSSTRNTWIVGILFALFLLFYMSYVLKMISTILDAENAAFLITDHVKENTPKFLEETERALVMKAPELADEMSRVFIQTIPQLRKVAQDQIDTAIEEMIPFLSREYEEVLTSYIKSHGGELRELTAVESPQEFADNFTKGLVLLFGEELNKYLRKEYGGRDLNFFKENSVLSLQAMNEHLEELLAEELDGMDRYERLQRRLLAIITHRLIQTMPEEWKVY